MRFYHVTLLGFFLVTGLFFSCKKDSSSLLPEITLDSPAEGQQFTVLDTIPIDLTISDDNGLSSYSLSLCNSAYMPVQASVNANLSGKAYHATYPYVIENTQLSDGDYYIVVSVTDLDNNVQKRYRRIYISALPLARKGFFLVAAPNPSQINVTKVDASWNAVSFGTFTGDYKSSAINNMRQQLYLCGKQNGPLRAVAIPAGTEAWAQQPLPSPTDYFTSASVMNDLLYVSYRDNAISAFDHTGAMRFNAVVSSSFYPVKTLYSNNRVFAEHKDPGGPSRKLIMYSASAGGGLQEALLPVEVVNMFARDAGSVYVIGNSGSQGKLLVYDVASNGFFEPVSLPAASVTSAAQVDANTLLLAMSNGTIQKFTYNPVGLLTHISGVQAQCLQFDALNSKIAAGEQNILRIYDYATGAAEQTVPVTDSIANVLIWYNR